MQRGGIGWSGNDGIRMNPPGTIGGKFPQGTKKVGFNIFESLSGLSDFFNRSASSLHDVAISENAGRDSLFKTLGTSSFI